MWRHSSPLLLFFALACVRLPAASSLPRGYTAFSTDAMARSFSENDRSIAAVMMGRQEGTSLVQAAKKSFVTSLASELDGDGCDLTVSFLFLARDDLPLARVWRKFLDGCPAGSYTVHIHSQSNASAPFALQEAVTVANATKGQLRFSYGMQDAMLKLYRSASQREAPNGCTPRWAQMLSDSCAPVRSCAEYRTELASHVGSSLIEKYESQGKECPIPAPWNEETFYKQSQWSTLWMEHAKLLLEHEHENYPAWKSHCLPDEHYTCNVLSRLGANITWHGVTEVMNGFGENGHPNLEKCRAYNAIVLKQVARGRRAPGGGNSPTRIFARKFARECEESLLQDIAFKASTLPPAPIIHISTL